MLEGEPCAHNAGLCRTCLGSRKRRRESGSEKDGSNKKKACCTPTWTLTQHLEASGLPKLAPGGSYERPATTPEAQQLVREATWQLAYLVDHKYRQQDWDEDDTTCYETRLLALSWILAALTNSSHPLRLSKLQLPQRPMPQDFEALRVKLNAAGTPLSMLNSAKVDLDLCVTAVQAVWRDYQDGSPCDAMGFNMPDADVADASLPAQELAGLTEADINTPPPPRHGWLAFLYASSTALNAQLSPTEALDDSPGGSMPADCFAPTSDSVRGNPRVLDADWTPCVGDIAQQLVRFDRDGESDGGDDDWKAKMTLVPLIASDPVPAPSAWDVVAMRIHMICNCQELARDRGVCGNGSAIFKRLEF